MPKPEYEKIEIDKPDMKLSLIFPSKETEDDEEIRRDVKEILSGALREQMQKKTLRREGCHYI